MSDSTQNTSILIGIVANVVLGLSLQLQKYAKKQIIHLALNGVPPISPQRWLSLAIIALVSAECANVLSFGLLPSQTISPIGVFTMVSNCVLPPLFFDKDTHVVVGSLVSMFGILVSILKTSAVPPPSTKTETIDLDFKKTMFLVSEVVAVLICLSMKSYRKSRCSFRLKGYTTLSAILGTQCIVAIIQVGRSANKNGNSALLILVTLVCFVLNMIIFNESMDLFPAWQVVPHYFIDLNVVFFLNTSILFEDFNQQNLASNLFTVVGLTCVFIGVLISAEPHFALPSNMLESGVLGQIKQNALNEYREQHDATRREIEDHTQGQCRLGEGPNCACLDNEIGHQLLEAEFRKFMQEKMNDLNELNPLPNNQRPFRDQLPV